LAVAVLADSLVRPQGFTMVETIPEC